MMIKCTIIYCIFFPRTDFSPM